LSDDASPVEILAQIDEARARLRELLRSADGAQVVTRPASGDWSAIENVRHLIFAEQLHLGRFVPGRPAWSPAGLAPHFLAPEAAFRDVGTAPTTDLDELFDIWDTLHAPMREVVATENERLSEALRGNLQHLSFHLGIIERLVSERR
jgi:hypothetical protein